MSPRHNVKKMAFDSNFTGSVVDTSTCVEVRCPVCNRMLFKADINPPTVIEIKCPGECKNLLKMQYM